MEIIVGFIVLALAANFFVIRKGFHLLREMVYEGVVRALREVIPPSLCQACAPTVCKSCEAPLQEKKKAQFIGQKMRSSNR
jgi:hypothetical protein